MLDVALGKLTGRAAQQVLAHALGRRVNERHRVLQLVAKAECAAGLIERVATPHAARENLIRQPAVNEDVERLVRRFDLYGTERVPPMCVDCGERFPRRRGTAKTPYEIARRVFITGRAKQEYERVYFTGGEIDARAERGTRIKPRADRTGKFRLGHGGRVAQCAVTAEEFLAIAANARRGVVDGEEGDAPGERGVVRIARQQRPGLRVEFRRDMHRRPRARVPQHPFDVPGCRKPPHPLRSVCKPQHSEFHRRVDRDVDGQFGFDSVFVVFEDAVTEPMPHDVRRGATGR